MLHGLFLFGLFEHCIGVAGTRVMCRACVRCFGHAGNPSSSMIVTIKDTERKNTCREIDERIMVIDYLSFYCCQLDMQSKSFVLDVKPESVPCIICIHNPKTSHLMISITPQLDNSQTVKTIIMTDSQSIQHIHIRSTAREC